MNLIKPIAIAFLLPGLFPLSQASPTIMMEESRNILGLDTLSWEAPLPFDQEVKTGKLENGFQYFIRKNVEPKDRVTMYLATKVGSVLETEEELGLAHFMEHMNFNGLKHFPKNELVDYLQRAGVRFGSDLNAYTSFDKTVYQLPIPSDDPELLKNGLQVLRDWAQDALLTDEEIDKERGVVLEEMRGGRGASQRMRDQYLPIMLNNSLYSHRLPIGTEDIIRNFPYEVLRHFHEKWYRPDLQALIIVGDIDVEAIEAEVRRLFGDLKSPENPSEHVEHKVPLLDKNQFIAVTDPEMTYTLGQISIKHPEEKVETVRDFRRSILKSVYANMLNARLSELGQSAHPPFIQASVGIDEFLGGLDAYTAFFVAKPNEFEGGFKALVRELERVQQHGFTETEFGRAIVSIQKNNETAYIERDKKKSDSYVNRYLNFYLEDSPALSNEDLYKLYKQLLPTLTLEEVEEIGKTFYVDANRDVIIMAPDKEKDNLPNQQQVHMWFGEVAGEEISAYDDKVSDLPLLLKEPQAGKTAAVKDIVAIETKEWTLDNGVKVILKPTTFKNDEILISAFSPGGTSLYDDSDYFSAAQAANLVNSSGVGQLNTIELRKYMTGKNVNISPYISERSEGVSGYADKEGLQTAFELIYGYFTEPRIEDDIFQSIITRSLSMISNQESDPSFVFRKSILENLYNGSIRRMPISEDGIKQIDKERALAIYKERFADASDFVFTIVGSFTEEEIKPYLENYLAALPVLDRKEEAKDLGLYEPEQGFEKIVHKGQEEKANVMLTYYGDYLYGEMENLNMNALESVLSIKLIERLREEESGVYGTGARASTNKHPKNRYSFTVSFGTGVDRYESLIASALDEINKVKQNGPLASDLEKFKIEQRRQLELSLKENKFWMGQLSGAYQREEDPTYINRYLEDLDKISVESVKDIANKYLKEDHLFKFVLLPDEK
ncbi:insulinase family protein [Sphingobacterium sp. DN00404]|uniref:Insulinase family protein n=1 Tax=Sphingobacterium micropteri TaxID=2763501 RepID=A0ABR7YLS2_9SPHI|nr:M16 family metallopeptidase [Sphingobacterium micropteri]MBD1432171.1 insulinase family protein [Sphingobacterium micropteri]